MNGLCALDELLDDMERALSGEAWYSALALALALPDICGRLVSPTLGSKRRFIAWFDQYVRHKYEMIQESQVAAKYFLEGSDCYALRCAYLHSGEHEISKTEVSDALQRFHFTKPRMGTFVHRNLVRIQDGTEKALQLQVDVFCREIGSAVRMWLGEVRCDDVIQQRIGQLAAIW